MRVSKGRTDGSGPSAIYRKVGTVIVLGVILLIVGIIANIGILTVIGIILLVVGAILAILGAAGRTVGGRSHWY